MGGPFKALVVEDFPLNVVRLAVVQDRGNGRLDYLMGDGSWHTSAADVVPVTPTPGILLPTGSLEAIHGAIARHLGDSLPGAGEVKVLREWLASEKQRVDAVLAAK